MSKTYPSYLHKQPSEVGDILQWRNETVIAKFFLEISQISFRIAIAKRK
jgi:hypothetical protein